MRKISKIMLLSLLLVFGLAILSGVSEAVVIDIHDGVCLEDLGHFTGTLNYVDTNATSGLLTVSLTNTSTLANGGFIVALVFNNPGNQITGVSLGTTNHLTTLLGGQTFNNAIKAAPYDNFDIGASLGGNNNTGFEGGGGNPQGGIAVGSMGSFTFYLTGTGMNTLTTRSFVDEANANGSFMAVRFRGFNDGGSDKSTAVHAPVPATLPLLGSGLLALLGLAVRRRLRKS
jgi:hypothetical protein